MIIQKKGRNEMLNINILSIFQYYITKNQLPEINDMKSDKQVLQNAKLIVENVKSNTEYQYI